MSTSILTRVKRRRRRGPLRRSENKIVAAMAEALETKPRRSTAGRLPLRKTTFWLNR